MLLSSFSQSLRFFLCFATATILDGPFFLSLYKGKMILFQNSVGITLLMHVFGALVMFFTIPKNKGWLHHKRNWALLASFFVLFLPAYGLMVILTMALLFRKEKPIEGIFDDEDFPLTFEVEDKAHRSRSEWATVVGEEIDFMPLVDAVNDPDIKLRRGAIERLGQLKTPEALAVLKSLAQDDSAEVRFYVNAALTKVKKSFEEELEASKLQLKRNPTSIDACLALAKAYYEYAQTNLMDENARDELLNQALHRLESLSSNDPDLTEQVKFLHFSILNELNDYDTLYKILKTDFDSEKNLEPEELRFLAEASYSLKDFETLKETLSNLGSQKEVDSTARGVAYWWTYDSAQS